MDESARDIEQDLALCEKATPGPWRVSSTGFTILADSYGTKEIANGLSSEIGQKYVWASNDVAFIAEAREALPYWLVEVKRLREYMDFLKQEYRDCDEPMTGDALELKARLKILQERDQLRAENQRLREDIRQRTIDPCGHCACTEICEDKEKQLRAENQRLKQWVNDLQSGMYVNCVYCGHRYGPESEVPASMAEVLKQHIEQCPEHPMSKLKAENERLKEALREIVDANDKHCYILSAYPADKMVKIAARALEVGK